MPANPTYEPYDGLTISASADPEPDPVMWTDSEPTFVIEFENAAEEKSKSAWNGESSMRLVLEVDGDLVWKDVVGFGPIGYNNKGTVEVEAGPPTYEGHAVLYTSISGARNLNSEGEAKLRPGRADSANDAIYAFSVWDKSHYEATVGTPKRLQAAIIGTSIVLIIFAAVQLYVAL